VGNYRRQANSRGAGLGEADVIPVTPGNVPEIFKARPLRAPCLISPADVFDGMSPAACAARASQSRSKSSPCRSPRQPQALPVKGAAAAAERRVGGSAVLAPAFPWELGMRRAPLGRKSKAEHGCQPRKPFPRPGLCRFSLSTPRALRPGVCPQRGQSSGLTVPPCLLPLSLAK